MTTAAIHPVLRLVGADDAPVAPALRSGIIAGAVVPTSAKDAAEQRIAKENASAATSSMSALDPRWILAVQATRELKANGSGAAAIITPEARRRLLLIGKRLGLRAFDTHMVVAIVQDHARLGEDPLSHEARARLDMVGPTANTHAEDTESGRPTWALTIALSIVGLFTGATIGAISIALLLR